MNQIYEDILNNAEIRITANRLLILKTIHEDIHGAFSLLDVESKMPTMDSSSILMQKYCICNCIHDNEHGCHYQHQGHVHLTCIKCHETICLEDVPIPSVPIPEGYEIHESEYVIKGICPKCQSPYRPK